MNEHYCQEHNSRFYRNEKVKDDGSLSVWFSHKLPDGSYCNEKAKTTPKKVSTPPSSEVDWDAKDRQSMAQTAMKSASEIVAAMVKVGVYKDEPISTDMGVFIGEEVKNMANKFYKELLAMKSE